MTNKEKLIRRFDAYNEVYQILSCLDSDEYKKIPKKLVETIDFYRNKQHEYKINFDIDLSKQIMLPETKAILFNIFKDYLATEEQKKKIIEFQKRDMHVLMRKKTMSLEEIYNSKVGNMSSFEKDNNFMEEKNIVKIENKSFIGKIIKKIKSIFIKNNR